MRLTRDGVAGPLPSAVRWIEPREVGMRSSSDPGNGQGSVSGGRTRAHVMSRAGGLPSSKFKDGAAGIAVYVTYV